MTALVESDRQALTELKSTHRNVLAVGYKNDRGEIVVTDVICANLPNLSDRELANISWKMQELCSKAWR